MKIWLLIHLSLPNFLILFYCSKNLPLLCERKDFSYEVLWLNEKWLGVNLKRQRNLSPKTIWTTKYLEFHDDCNPLIHHKTDENSNRTIEKRERDLTHSFNDVGWMMRFGTSPPQHFYRWIRKDVSTSCVFTICPLH